MDPADPAARAALCRRFRPLCSPALSLTSATVAEDVASGALVGAVQGAAPGSSLSLIDNAGGRFVLQGGNLRTGLVPLDFKAVASHSVSIRESLAWAANSPRDTVVTVTDVAEAGPADPPTSLLATRSIAFGPRNGDGAANSLLGPQLTQAFDSGTVGGAGAIAARIRIHSGGFAANSGAVAQTATVQVMVTTGATGSRGVDCGFGALNNGGAGIRGRFTFHARDQGGNYAGDRDSAGNTGAIGSSRLLRTPAITANDQGSWTGLVILRRDGAGQFQALAVTAEGLVLLGDTFTPAAWTGITTTTLAMVLGSAGPGQAASFGNYFPGDVCDFMQLAGAGSTDAEWQSVALGADPAAVFGANLAAHYRLAGTGDLVQTAGSRAYAAFTLNQTDAARPITDGPQLRPRRKANGDGLFARLQFPGYVHAVGPAGVRAASSRAAVAALTVSVMRDVLVTGAATHVEARALTPAGAQLVGWTRVTTSPATGFVEITLPGVPVGEVVIEYRREDDPAVIAVMCDRERVGVVVCLIGQSQTQIAMGDAQ